MIYVNQIICGMYYISYNEKKHSYTNNDYLFSLKCIISTYRKKQLSITLFDIHCSSIIILFSLCYYNYDTFFSFTSFHYSFYTEKT